MRRAVYDRKAKEFPVRRADATWAGEDLIAAMHSAEPLTPAQPVSRLEEISLLRSFQTFVPSASEIFDRLWSNFELVTRPKAERLMHGGNASTHKDASGKSSNESHFAPVHHKQAQGRSTKAS
jgi:hypothetical protein